MTDREAMKLALEALEDTLALCINYKSVEDADGYVFTEASDVIKQGKSAHNALRQALDHVPDTTKMTEPDMGIDRGAWDDVPDATKWVDELRGDETEEEEPVAFVCRGKFSTINHCEECEPLYTAPPKPAQYLIVGYADSHDISRDGHDFWVSRQSGKNTVPLYLYGHPPKIWQGLTDEEIAEGAKQSWVDKQAFESSVWWAEEKLKGKNS